jgi:hypothetical protein
MVMIYRLTPIDPKHESWRLSSVTGQYVRLWAHDCTDARIKAARATDTHYVESVDPQTRRCAEIEHQKSPWELPEVTSCEEDPGEPAPPNDILTQNGATMPIWAQIKGAGAPCRIVSHAQRSPRSTLATSIFVRPPLSERRGTTRPRWVSCRRLLAG